MTIEHKAYWSQRTADMNAANASDAEYAASYTGRLEAAQRQLNIAATDDQRAAALAALDVLMAEADDAFAATWTVATTQQRRAEWRATIAHIQQSPKTQHPGLVYAAQAKQGWTVEDLRRAVALHNL